MKISYVEEGPAPVSIIRVDHQCSFYFYMIRSVESCNHPKSDEEHLETASEGMEARKQGCFGQLRESAAKGVTEDLNRASRQQLH